MLVLPSANKLRSERNSAGAVKPGIQPELPERLKAHVGIETGLSDRIVAVLIDEMTIRGTSKLTY